MKGEIRWGQVIVGVLVGWLVLPLLMKVLTQKNHPAAGGTGS